MTPLQLHLLLSNASVLCVEAKQERPQLWLLREPFDRYASRIPAVRRLKFDYEVADLLGLHPTVWSLYRTGARPVPAEFIAMAIKLMPRVPVTKYVTTTKPEVTP